MDEITKSFFSRNWELDEVQYHGDPDKREMLTSNGCLDTAKWYFGKEMNCTSADAMVPVAIMLQRFRSSHGELTHYHKSHDNFTGLVSVAKAVGFPYRELDLDKERTYHPRPQIYWAWARNPNFINKLGLILIGLMDIVTCLRTYKVRNGKKLVKTSTELLMVLKYRSGLKDLWYMRPFGFICHKLLERRFGKAYLTNMQELRYPRAKDHPVKVEWARIPVGFKWWRP